MPAQTPALKKPFSFALFVVKSVGDLCSCIYEGARVFGRNTCPIDNPHGYEFFLTVGRDIEPDGDIDMKQIPGWLYAVLLFKNLGNIGNAWEHLWNWIRDGWCNGFEEQINWHEGTPPNEWVFDLLVKLRE